MKKKVVASILAFTFGLYGVHRFYLGQRLRGILHFLLGIFSVAMAIEEGVPIIILPAIIAFIDGILLAVMPKEEFDEKFNKKYIARQYYRQRETPEYRPPHAQPPTHTQKSNPFKRRGIEKFKDYDFEGAIEDFKKSLNAKYNDPAIHFNLACCYSMNEDVDQSLFHLDKAISFGMVDLDKIFNHEALAYLRTRPDYEAFIANGYKLPQEELPPQKNNIPTTTVDLLEQIEKLGELRESGILTEEEFQAQKQRLFK